MLLAALCCILQMDINFEVSYNTEKSQFLITIHFVGEEDSTIAVSYTHLDVYKRQGPG